MDPVEITADGLLLRPWRAVDADAVHRACQDPDIQRWTSVPRPYELHHAATFGTDDRAFSLRAERDGNGTGRIYTVIYRVTDKSGNQTVKSAIVTVPHDNGK